MGPAFFMESLNGRFLCPDQQHRRWQQVHLHHLGDERVILPNVTLGLNNGAVINFGTQSNVDVSVLGTRVSNLQLGLPQNARFHIGAGAAFLGFEPCDANGGLKMEGPLNDALNVGVATVNFFGGAGDDLVFGAAAASAFFFADGGAGGDPLFGGLDSDFLYGGLGHDRMDGGAGDDLMLGDFELDTLHGGSGDDTILGEDGDDLIEAGRGDDEIDGGAGLDTGFWAAGDMTGSPAATATIRLEQRGAMMCC